MSRFSEPKQVRVDSLKIDPATAPKSDETLIRLIQAAVKGTVPVYFAIIPLSLCGPFDTEYRPDVHPGVAALTEARAKQVTEQPIAMLVYPKGRWFVVSDDYPTLWAYQRALPDYVPCVVLGKPEGEGVEIVQGPLTPEEAKAAIFGGSVVAG